MIWALHGNLGSPDDWSAFTAVLGEEVVPPILWEPKPEPFSAWARNFNDEVRRQDPKPIVIGYSLGGRLAMHAVTAPNAPWKAAIFVSAHPGLGDRGARAFRVDSDRQWTDLLRSGSKDAFLERWNAQATLQGEPVSGRQAEVVGRYSEAIAEAFHVWSLGNQKDLRSSLADCHIPQLWVAGAEDRKFAGLMREAAAHVPSASYAEIEASGHRVPLRNPSGLAECVRRFLASLSL